LQRTACGRVPEDVWGFANVQQHARRGHVVSR
jgi:hypothetical protein